MANTIFNEPGMKEALQDKLLISVLAGVTIPQLCKWAAPSTIVVRAMPNTPCKVRTIFCWLIPRVRLTSSDPRRDDSCYTNTTWPTSRASSRDNPEYFLVNWQVPVLRRKAFRRLHGALGLGACLCMHCPGSHGRWWCYDGFTKS